MARAYLAAATTRSPRSVAARAGRVAGWNGEDRRVTGPPGALADFVAAGTPEPVVRYRSVMMNPASTGDAYSAGRSLSARDIPARSPLGSDCRPGAQSRQRLLPSWCSRSCRWPPGRVVLGRPGQRGARYQILHALGCQAAPPGLWITS